MPLVTYAVSGIDDFYRAALPDAEVPTGLAISGEPVTDAGAELDDWLRTSQLAR